MKDMKPSTRREKHERTITRAKQAAVVAAASARAQAETIRNGLATHYFGDGAEDDADTEAGMQRKAIDIADRILANVGKKGILVVDLDVREKVRDVMLYAAYTSDTELATVSWLVRCMDYGWPSGYSSESEFDDNEEAYLIATHGHHEVVKGWNVSILIAWS